MQNYRTETEIREHLANLVEQRKPTQDKAHDEFNKGVQFVVDYITDFIDTKRFKVFVKKEQMELVKQVEKLLGLSSYPEIGKGSVCPTGMPYITIVNGTVKDEGEEFSITEFVRLMGAEAYKKYEEMIEDNDYIIYWRIYPSYETTDNGTYVRMRLAIDKKI